MKKSLLVEADGGPLALVVAPANVPDAKLLAATLDAVVLERPPVEPPEWPQHLSLDAGFDDDASYLAALDRDYTPHIASHRAPPPRPARRFPARRWVVERTLAWLSRWRGILVRWEKMCGLGTSAPGPVRLHRGRRAWAPYTAGHRLATPCGGGRGRRWKRSGTPTAPASGSPCATSPTGRHRTWRGS